MHGICKSLMAGLIATVAIAGTAQAEWTPTKDLEFVVGAGPGGGSDQFARMIQSIIQKHDLAPVDVIVTNKPAGAGAETFMYGVAGGNDPNKLLFGNNNAWLLPMKARVAYSMEDLTPVAAMASDAFILWVKADSPWQTYADVAEAAKAGALRAGGTQSKDGDEILVAMMAADMGGAFTYIPFKSGSEAAVQLAGGHLDINTNNPAENAGQWAGGTVRPVCVFASAALVATAKVTADAGFADIPTCASQGSGIGSYQIPRTIFTAADLDDDQRAFFDELFRKVHETPEWKAYLEATTQGDLFLLDEEFAALIAEETSVTQQVFAREGWLIQ